MLMIFFKVDTSIGTPVGLFGMTAMHQAFMEIKLGYDDIILATSFEHHTQNPSTTILISHQICPWFSASVAAIMILSDKFFMSASKSSLI